MTFRERLTAPRSLLLPEGGHAGAGAGAGARRARPTALFTKGFRPFFLLAALFAAGVIPLWLLVLGGRVVTPPYLEATAFHGHEMLQGYAVAVLAGFLLTAVGNWTRRETAVGGALLALALLWVAGRATLLASDALPRVVPAVVDLAFLPALIATLARPLLATQDRRNYVMLGILAALWLANVAVHLEALGYLPYGVGRRANLAALNAVVLVMSVMAARVVPMFTRNATGVGAIRSQPQLDRAAFVAILLAGLLELVLPGSVASGCVFGAAGLLVLTRSAHWGTRHTLRDPLLWSLHIAHGWLALGLIARGAALVALPALTSFATHALTVGALGGLTLAMMVRVALGHTGRPLVAPRTMVWAFAAMNLAALVRCVGPLMAPTHFMNALVVSGGLWSLAFVIFAVTYAPVLFLPRVDGRPG